MKQNAPTPPDSRDLESYWRPKFEASAAQGQTDAARNIGHDVGHHERLMVFQDLLTKYTDSTITSVLDVGCGSGTYFDLYQRQNWAIHGVDYSAGQISLARERHPAAQLFAGPIDQAPPEFCADIVVCIGVTQVVSDLEAFLHELSQRVRDGGIAVISCLNARSIWPGSILDPHLRFFSLQEMSTLMGAEFEIQHVRRFYPLPLIHGLLRPLLYRIQLPLLNHGFMFVLKPLRK